MPYWRKAWRLTVTTSCRVHGRPVIESCPACSSAFIIDKLRQAPLDRCAHCGWLISSHCPKGPTSDTVGSIESSIHELLIEPQRQGFCAALTAQLAYDLPLLLSALCRPSEAELLRTLQSALGEPAIQLEAVAARPAHLLFNAQSLAVRGLILQLLNKLKSQNSAALSALLESEPERPQWPARRLRIAQTLLTETRSTPRRIARSQ